MDECPHGVQMTVGLIVNPKSGKQAGKGLNLAQLLAGRSEIHVKILHRFDDLVPSMCQLAELGIDILAISSGDGTIQQVQTELAERNPFKALPTICLLPHGTTNMTAADLGIGTTNIERQALLLSDVENRKANTHMRRRHTVRIANPRDGKVRHGMFVGTGAVWRGTVFCQQAVHGTGLRGDWATFATLAAAIAKSFLSSNAEGSISRPYPMAIRTASGLAFEGEQLLFLATTLERLILGCRPFWGMKCDPLQASIFPYPPPNVLRWLWPAMYGSRNRKMPPGCESFTSNRIMLETQCPFVIDGEFFEPPVGEPLVIETGTELTYVCGA